MKNLLLVIFIFLCISCSTVKYVDREVPIEVVRTEYINQIYKDSIFIHDSIDRYISGDTVYLYKYKYIYKYLSKTDTVLNTDTIEVPVKITTTEVKKVNELKWYQSFLMWIGGIALFIIISILGVKIRNFLMIKL